MRKLLIVIPSLIQGGGQKFVADLAQRIDRNRFKVKVLVYYKSSNSVFDQFVKEHNIDTQYLDKKVGLDMAFFKQVKKAVKDYDPDIIHTNLDSMLYLLPFYRKKQVKLHTVHNIAEKESRGLQRLVRNTAYRFLGVKPVGISHTVADTIATVHHIKRERIPVVYNGVDCSRYRLPKASKNTLNFINIGTIRTTKNLSFLVDCFEQVHRKFPNTHLTLVGDGHLRPQLEEQIRDLHIEEHVTITGTVGDVENYLASADVYVASSVYEGLPISILEALSSGIPVISTNVGGVPDIINENNGILIDFGDKNGYIQAMETLAGNVEKRQALAAGALESSLKYDISIMTKQYEHLYTET